MTLLYDAWYVAAQSDELGREPLGRKLLGRNVVIFRDQAGIAHAIGARCVHRGADLAQGRLVEGTLECPFHGWRFDGSGRCVLVPSQPPDHKISSRACVQSFPLREESGFLWIWMGARNEDPPAVPHYEFWGNRVRSRRVRLPARLHPAPLLRAVEDQIDAAHRAFIHTTTAGPSQDPLVDRQKVTVDPDGRGLRVEDDRESPWTRRSPALTGIYGFLGKLVGQKQIVENYMRFDLGGIVHIYVQYETGTFDAFVTALTPADGAQTWLFYESVRTRAAYRWADGLQRSFMNTVLREGAREAEFILQPDRSSREVSVEADAGALAVRKLYMRAAREESPQTAEEPDLRVAIS